MRMLLAVIGLSLALGCGARRALPEPLPETVLNIEVEQAIVAQEQVLLVGMEIGSNHPDGVIVDAVDASVILHGADLGELELVPMMEAHMPPWTLMLMWNIPAEVELNESMRSSVRGTVTWHVKGQNTARTPFELQLELGSSEGKAEEEP